MPLTARDIMKTDVRTVAPDLPLPDLERQFVKARLSGFPVIEGGRVVGIVSRSDVIRQLSVEQSVAETVSDYYHDVSGFPEEPGESLDEIAGRVGQRLEHLRVQDVMISNVVSVSPEAPVREVARTLIDKRIHRVLVTEGENLVGIISSLDLVRIIAEGRGGD